MIVLTTFSLGIWNKKISIFCLIYLGWKLRANCSRPQSEPMAHLKKQSWGFLVPLQHPAIAPHIVMQRVTGMTEKKSMCLVTSPALHPSFDASNLPFSSEWLGHLARPARPASSMPASTQPKRDHSTRTPEGNRATAPGGTALQGEAHGRLSWEAEVLRRAE